jgi:TonB family protein
MSELFVTKEFGEIERTTRRSLTYSVAVHIALFLLLVFSHKASSESAGLTEITWVDAAPYAEPEAAAQPVAREETRSAPVQPVKTVARKAENTERFERPLERADVAPKPQSRAIADIMSDKIDAMESHATAERTRIASLAAPPKVGVPAPVGAKTVDAPASRPSTLERSDKPSSGPPSALTRTETRAGVPVAAVAVPKPTVGNPAPAEPSKSNATRNLAGAQLVGPVADRPLLSYRVPTYPEWAKRDAVEGSVTLYFFVLPDGSVKSNIVVERTSGFSDFDSGAMDALRDWKFKALPGSGEQWGRITFNYRLSDAQ